MRILIDTNILFSALLFPHSTPARALLHATEHFDIYLCEQNISEFSEILARKAPSYLPSAESFLMEFSFTKIPAIYSKNQTIRDVSDQPILNAAIKFNIDVIITGDKDFLNLNIKHPKCLTAAKYLEQYAS